MAFHDLEINLDLKQNLNVYANCKQLDTLHLIFNIFDDGVQADLSNYNVRLMAMKPDNIPLIQDTDYTVVNNVVTIIAHEQLTTTSGVIKIELQFINKITGEKKATFNLNLKVIASTLEIERSISAATYTLLEELENKLDQAVVISENIDEAIEINKILSVAIADSGDMKNTLEIDIEKGNDINTDLTKNIADGNITNTTLENSITTGNQLKNDIDAKNEQAESNIKAMESFEDVTKLTQIVADHTTQLSENTQDIAKISNPSLLINDCFQVCQRSATGTFTNPTSGTYTYDRWRADITTSNNTFTKLINGIRWVATGEGRLRQLFEDIECNKLLGKTVTLSAKFKGSLELIFADFGYNTIYVTSGIITNNDFAIKSITIDIPVAVSGKLGVYLHNLNSSVDIEWVKLELGDKATPFVPRLYAEELALCMRYYEVVQRNLYNVETVGFRQPVQFKVNKRAVPITTIANPYGSVGKAGKWNNTTFADTDINGWGSSCIGNADIIISGIGTFIFDLRADAEIY